MRARRGMRHHNVGEHAGIPSQPFLDDPPILPVQLNPDAVPPVPVSHEPSSTHTEKRIVCDCRIVVRTGRRWRMGLSSCVGSREAGHGGVTRATGAPRRS